MLNPEANKLRQSIEDWAGEKEPQGGLTSLASVLNTIFSGILGWPTMILALVSTLVLGILSAVTFGIGLLPFVLVLWLLNIGTVGTSWLWINVPQSRLLILLPGVILAGVQSNYTGLLPYSGDWDSRSEDLARAYAWPHSYYIQQLPRYKHEALIEWESLKQKFENDEITNEHFTDEWENIWVFFRSTSPDLCQKVLDEYNEIFYK